MNQKPVYRIGNDHYQVTGPDPGFQHPEDHGRFYAYRVDWDRKKGKWQYNDDDVYIIDRNKVYAKEIGWDHRRIAL